MATALLDNVPTETPATGAITAETEEHPLHIVLISIHGLIRAGNLELGRDPDTGGQTKYVVELAKALARQPDVGQVHLITRRIVDESVDSDYAAPSETLAPNAEIIRIDAGPEGYIRKEELWDYLDSFADNALAWLQKRPRWPDIFHSHYADAGYVGVKLAQWTGVPLLFTGHSLGRDKCRRLLAGGMSMADIEQRYHASRRIDAEEETLVNADCIITSTRDEIEQQYELYDCYIPEKMVVMPPGTNLEEFHPPGPDDGAASFRRVLDQFLVEPEKPVILALSRLDERKNIIALVEAFGETPRLRQLANLVIVAGNRDDIREMPENQQLLMTELLWLVDYYDLYGSVALPKHHRADEVADIYRIAALSRGVFINPALTEPFGLTLLEAAATGLPVAATENGGPVDIIANCRNGLLFDPLDRQAMASALLAILENPRQWQTFSENGLENVRRFYSWEAHARNYLDKIRFLIQTRQPLIKAPPAVVRKRYPSRALVTALDQALLGDGEGLAQFIEFLQSRRKQFLFVIATWRRMDAAAALLKKHRIPLPDILIAGLGTEIYYAPQLIADIAWTFHIDHLWTPAVLRRIVGEWPGLLPKPRAEQSRYKLSYNYDPAAAPSPDEINSRLRQMELSANPVLSLGRHFDLLPARASEGKALRYVARQWDIPLERILVFGGSNADEDMLRGNTLGVVAAAAKRPEELSVLVPDEHLYFAEKPFASGLLEAVEHYDFFNL